MLTHSNFVAASFLDEVRTDRDGRSIKHYLLYLLDSESSDDFRLGWHSGLVQALSAPYEEIFSLSPEDLAKSAESTTLFDIKELTDRFHDLLPENVEVDLSDESEPGSWQVVSIHMTPPVVQEPSKNKRNAIIGGTISAIGIGALLASLWNRWDKKSQSPGADAHAKPGISSGGNVDKNDSNKKQIDDQKEKMTATPEFHSELPDFSYFLDTQDGSSDLHGTIVQTPAQAGTKSKHDHHLHNVTTRPSGVMTESPLDIAPSIDHVPPTDKTVEQEAGATATTPSKADIHR